MDGVLVVAIVLGLVYLALMPQMAEINMRVRVALAALLARLAAGLVRGGRTDGRQ